MRVNSRSFHRIWIFLTAINFLFSACTINKLEFKFSPPPTNVAVTAPFPAPRVEVIFNVEIPAQTAGQKSIYLDILDELTGLALNPYRYGMSMIDQTHYRVHVAVPPNSLIKYRYLREENPPEVEHTLSGSQVRYRMYFVTGPGTVTDFVSSWESTPSTREWGRVQGIIADTENQPIPNILVAAGGKQTFTSGGGYFLLEGLSPGIHNLVAYSIQGQFKPFQQGVQVAPGATTPATIQLLPHKLVKTTFYASLPPELVQEDQVFELRLVGDLYGLGNTFADLAGGINSTALQASKMVKNEDERYTTTLELPEGFLFRYKYSLGDGFWNSELTDDGRFQIREIVPSETDKTVEDSPIQFALPEWGAITFKVDVPPDTPQEDVLFIQFNPYGWTEPVPMIRLNEHTWQYKLFSPLHLLGSVYYRYCRNSQCESAGEQLDASGNPKERKFIPSPSPQTFKDKIDSWLWEEKLAPFSVDKNIPVEPARSQFFGGLEFQPGYHPSWLPFIPQALSDIKEMGANQVILTPTWTASSQNPPVLEPLLAHDFFWPDLINISKAAQSLGVKTAVYPQINFPESSQAWWEGIIDNAAWQRSWFDRYKLFVRNFAVLTEKSEAEILILGNPRIAPALPIIPLPDTNLPLTLDNAEYEWKTLIAQVRSTHPAIKLFWIIEVPSLYHYSPQFLENFDGFYVLLNPPVTFTGDTTPQNLTDQIGKFLDENLFPIWEQTNKPLILAVQIPSTDVAGMGCIDPTNTCTSFTILDQLSAYPVSGVNFEVQAFVYQSYFQAISQRKWVGGFVSRGFYPPVILRDISSSIRGKPAEEVAGYWFPRLLLQTK